MSKALSVGLGFAALLLAATLAVAEEQPAPSAGQPTANGQTPQPAATPEDPNDPNKVICKREQMTGTRVATQRICMTRREWDERAGESDDSTRRWQRAQDAAQKPIGPH